MVVRRLVENIGSHFQHNSLIKGLISDVKVEEKRLYCLLPLTHMNHSGTAVKRLLDTKDLSPLKMLVVSDDLSLDFGQVRIRERGSDGGHNGLRSVIESLGTRDFARLRMGIGFSPQGGDTVDYVLGEFQRSEKKELEGFIDQAVECCLVWLREGTRKAMDQFNRRNGHGKS
jgi:PTH1 family peptidyl-tRNA hydrolase